MKYDIKCKKCGKLLSFNNVARVTDLNHKPIPSCKDCEEDILKELKTKRFVEHYNDSDIYQFEGKYVPYWGCNYYFTTLEDCRNRIDSKDISIVLMRFIGE